MSRSSWSWLLCLLLGCDTTAHEAGDAARPAAMTKPPRISVFSKTAGYRHEAIEPGKRALMEIAKHHGATLQLTEDSAELIASLKERDVVVFLNTTGDVLDDAQETLFEAFIQAGGGFVGVHSSADTEYDWPFYEALNGAWFADHPAIQAAQIKLERPEHPAVAFLPRVWARSDEWYNFRRNPREQVEVLLTLDETSYQGGTMGVDHPIAWCRSEGALGRGRAFYTALGHTLESWQEKFFLKHIEAALLWAAHIDGPVDSGVR